jgi:hypothetical protein
MQAFRGRPAAACGLFLAVFTCICSASVVEIPLHAVWGEEAVAASSRRASPLPPGARKLLVQPTTVPNVNKTLLTPSDCSGWAPDRRVCERRGRSGLGDPLLRRRWPLLLPPPRSSPPAVLVRGTARARTP